MAKKKIFMWSILFAFFCVHEYSLHGYILIIVFQSRFSFLSSAKDSLFFNINSISSFKLLSTYFDQSKLKQNFLGAPLL